MIKQQELYEAFLTRVEPEHRAFAAELHELFVNNGCTVEIKPTSSGFLVSYKFAPTKKAVANFVFRKSGLLLRLYADHASRDEALLSALPEDLLAAIRKAPDCKRLTRSGACNPRRGMRLSSGESVFKNVATTLSCFLSVWKIIRFYKASSSASSPHARRPKRESVWERLLARGCGRLCIKTGPRLMQELP